jgi:hypothetical protein
MDQDLRVGQRHPLAGGAAREQQRAHRHRDADADRLHVGLDELHRVVDRQPGVHRAAGRVDVERDVLVGILGLQVQQLRDDQVRDLIVDGRAEEDDPLVEQAAVDVERALPAGGLLDDHRYEWAHGPRYSFSLPGPEFLPDSSFSPPGQREPSAAGSARRSAGTSRLEMPLRCSAFSVSSTISCARACTSWCGTSIWRRRRRRVEHRPLELVLDLVLLLLLQPRRDVLAQLSQRVHPGRVGGELVVELGQLLRLDLGDGDLEGPPACLPVLGAVVVGERDLDLRCVTGAAPTSCSSKPGISRPEPSSSELVTALAALKRDAVDRAEVVDHHVVAVLGRALNRLKRRRSDRATLELGVDRRSSATRLAARTSIPCTCRAWRRAHTDLERERQRRALSRQLADVQVGLADRHDPGDIDRLGVPVAERLRNASSSTASRPRRRITTCAGTLPLRKPGTRSERPSFCAAS